MALIIGLPGIIALLVCIRRGPERALLDVYLPTLLLLPSASYHWNISGQLTLSDTAIVPIAGFVIARYWGDWKWSFTDLLVIGYLAASVMSGYMNKGFAEAHNIAFNLTCSLICPYIVAKGIPPREDLYVKIAKRFVTCVAVVAIINVWEFRMGRDLFDVVFGPLFPGQDDTGWQGRMGFNRTFGPYVHPILAGIVFGIAFWLCRWLHWGKYWPDRLPYLPLSWTRACNLWIIAGSVMTLSRGPWMGVGVAALVILIGRSRKRMQTIVVVTFLVVTIGDPIYQAASSYVSSPQAASEMQSAAAYRHQMNQEYIAIIEERPAWGWGRNNHPIVDGMASIDNDYLLVALDCGLYALTLFLLMLVWITSRLVLFCSSHHGLTFPGSIALIFLGIYVLLIVSIATVYLGGQTFQLLYLLSGWNEALILGSALPIVAAVRPAKLPKFNFQRVMT
jgi:O-Antigen ligase